MHDTNQNSLIFPKITEYVQVQILSQETNWIPCIFELASEVGKVVCTPHEVAVKENVSNLALTYTVPVPAIRGGRRLLLGGVTVGMTIDLSSRSVKLGHISDD